MLYVIFCIVLIITICIAVQRRLREFVISNLSVRHVLITGCDSGFGKLLAKRLDKLGMHVFATCITTEGVKHFKATSSERMTPIQMDLTKQDSIDEVYNLVKSQLCNKGLWAIVNNAGVMGSSGLNPIDWCTIENFQEVMNVNLYGQVRMTIKFLPLIRKAMGRIVNMSSVSGRVAIGSGPYVCSKFAVEGFTDTLRTELYTTGVTVHVLQPSGYRTNITSGNNICDIIRKSFKQLDEEKKSYYGDKFANEMCNTFKSQYDANMSSDLNQVIDAYTHAVTAKWPKARYIVGMDANTFYRLLWNIPEWMTARLLNTFIWPKPEAVRKHIIC